ncbi:hypothetical protein [Streptomyces longispororuber]|uniref:hypothetical protein n=1 Tax=Streptomyces longispororuber TaxID=68230 RepID=UPI0036F822C2
MTVSRRTMLRSAAAAAPALALAGTLPGTASAAQSATPAAESAPGQWEVRSLSPWDGGLLFHQLSVAPDGTALAVGTDISLENMGTYHPVAFTYGGTDWKTHIWVKFPDDTRPMTGAWATGAGDAWAVGERWDRQPMRDVPQLMHWNGAAWTDRTAGAAVRGPVHVDGAGKEVWVVGRAVYPAPGAAALRRTGSGWTPVALPAGLGAAARLNAVRVVAADDVWVAGYAADKEFGTRTPLVMRWNGSSWTRLPAPFGPAAGHVSALLVRDGVCWAGGSVDRRAAAATWDGRAWSLRSPSGLEASEVGHFAAYGTQVWAAGTRMPLQRWTGSSWSAADGPLPGTLTADVVTHGPDGALWLAGHTEDTADRTTTYFLAKLPAAAA